MGAEPPGAVTGLLLDVLDESYGRFAWHGPNLSQALQGADAGQANWRPPSGAAPLWNIREIVVHVAVHMERAGSSLSGAEVRVLPTHWDEKDFPLTDLKSDEEWAGEIAFLRGSYDGLRAALSEARADRLQEISPSRAYGREWTFQNLLYGVCLHNVYHASRIVSLRKSQDAWTELA